MNAIDRLIAVAEGELGYLEKKSNKDLDDKTANAGSANYTKYNRDMKAWVGSAGLSDQWCQNFVDWVFVVAFGLELARALIHRFTNYTPDGSGAFKKKGQYYKRGSITPKRGDVIYFYSSAKGRIGHVGIVYAVSGSKVYTIEGNTSGASSLVTNGGGVRKKSYSQSSSYIDGYGRPDYSVAEGRDFDAPARQPEQAYRLGDRVLKNGCEGEDVKELQEALISLGFDCGSYGADGEFGDCTEMAVRKFQIANGLDNTGEYAPADHGALMAALEGNNVHVSEKDARYVQIETGKRCFVRRGPGTQYEDIGVAYSGQKLAYLGRDSETGWHEVEFNGPDGRVNGWVSGKYSKLVVD